MEQKIGLTIEEKVEEAFKGKRIDYERVFQNIYPAHGRNGFTERNQTFFFTHNYLKNNPGAICWQEVPFGNKEHIDTLIIDGGSIIYIEAKRISSQSKLNSINKDFSRLLDEKNRNTITKGLSGRKENKEYILYLADIWAEGKAKQKLITYLKEQASTDGKKMNSFIACDLKLSNNILCFETFSCSDDEIRKAINKYCIAYSLVEIIK